MIKIAVVLAAALATNTVLAEPVTYKVDPNHTYPSFEADHQGGLSIWRGKIKSTIGSIVLDRTAHTGTVDVTMDMKTIDFGHDGMNKHAMAADILDVEQFPTATYHGTITFNGELPAGVDGTLTLHGVTRPVKLTLNSFLCKPDTVTKVDRCGADAAATFNRDDFGIDFVKAMGYRMPVKLAIQVEAIKNK
jgi:polyisoprenoid-binding protein YceI